MCARYSVLHDDITGTLTEALENTHSEEDLSLSDKFLKATEISTKALLTVEEQLSGYHIFKYIEDSASTKKSDSELELLYILWIPIKSNRNESIRAYEARAQTFSAQFDSTDYEVNPKSLVCRWCKVIGYDFQSINKMVDETGIILDG